MLSPLERRLLDRALERLSSATGAIDTASRLVARQPLPELQREIVRARNYMAHASLDVNRITHPGDFRDLPPEPEKAA